MKILSTLSVAGAVGIAMAVSGVAYAAEDCKPSKWGADDELGAANYVTPKQVMAAVKLVKKGESHPLGIVIDSSTPALWTPSIMSVFERFIADRVPKRRTTTAEGFR